MFFNSQTESEQNHIIAAFIFELSKVETKAIRERMVGTTRERQCGDRAESGGWAWYARPNQSCSGKGSGEGQTYPRRMPSVSTRR